MNQIAQVFGSVLQLYYSCIVPVGWISPMGNLVAFLRESQLQQSFATQPMVHAGCFNVSTNPLKSDMDHRIFNVCTDVSACSCTRGCMDTVRESALKVDFGRRILCHTRESNLPQQRTGPMLCQLSYVPHPKI